jgi:hypothetical protein
MTNQKKYTEEQKEFLKKWKSLMRTPKNQYNRITFRTKGQAWMLFDLWEKAEEPMVNLNTPALDTSTMSPEFPWFIEY